MECSICGAPLSLYNKTGQCFHHSSTERELSREREEALLSQPFLPKEKPFKRKLPREKVFCQLVDKDNTQQKVEDLVIRTNQIISKVAEAYKIEAKEILEGKSRKENIAQCRQVVMYLLREECKMSFPQIGHLLSRDHSTVMHGHEKITLMITKGSVLAEIVANISSACKS